MNVRRFNKLVVLAGLVISALTLTAAFQTSATARSLPVSGSQFVNVNVGFNTQVLLTDVSEQTLIDKQQTGRKFLYKMASKECAVLKATIAKTCRLTNLNISAQLREKNNQTPLKLYLNGNAQFVITLKEKASD